MRGEKVKLSEGACKVIAKLISIVGAGLALFVAGYIFLIKPIYTIFTGFMQDTLTSKDLLINIVLIFLAATVGGGIWIVFDMIAGIFRDMHGKEE